MSCKIVFENKIYFSGKERPHSDTFGGARGPSAGCGDPGAAEGARRSRHQGRLHAVAHRVSFWTGEHDSLPAAREGAGQRADPNRVHPAPFGRPARPSPSCPPVAGRRMRPEFGERGTFLFL